MSASASSNEQELGVQVFDCICNEWPGIIERGKYRPNRLGVSDGWCICHQMESILDIGAIGDVIFREHTRKAAIVVKTAILYPVIQCRPYISPLKIITLDSLD